MEVLLSRDDENRTEQTRCTNNGVNALCSDVDAAVSDDPLDDQLPLMLLPALST